MKAGVQGAGVIEDKVWSKGAVILEFVLGTSLFLLVDWDNKISFWGHLESNPFRRTNILVCVTIEIPQLAIACLSKLRNALPLILFLMSTGPHPRMLFCGKKNNCKLIHVHE